LWTSKSQQMENKKSHIIPPTENLKSNFKVPQGYFEQNAVQLKQIAKTTPKAGKVISLKPFIGWLSAAAAVALIVFGVIYRNSTTTNFTDDDLYELVEVGYVSFSSDELLEQIELEDLEEYFEDPSAAYDYLETNDLEYLETDIYEFY